MSFWDALTELERRDLRRAGTVRTCTDGTVLFHEGDSSDAVLIILRGSVKVITNSSGGHRRLLAVRGCGEVIGEVSGIWRTPRSATVQAADRVEVLSIPRAAFVRVLERSPSTAMELIRVLGERRRHADHERTEFGGSSVAQRVSAALVDLSSQHAAMADGSIVITLTQDELASLAATSRSGVARALLVLREHQVVITMPRQIVVLDIERLRAGLVTDRVSSDVAAVGDLR